VSANPIDPVEEKRQQINALIDEIARLAESGMSPPEFGQEFLQRILLALATNIGAIWLKTPQGNLSQQYQIGIADLNLENIEGAKASHDQILRAVLEQGKPLSMPPKSGPGIMEGAPAPANLTNCILLFAPIVIDRQVQGVLEVGLDPNRNPAALRGFLQFMNDMCLRRQLLPQSPVPHCSQSATGLDTARSLHPADSQHSQSPRGDLCPGQ
jgi:hypothetical protein